MLPTGSRSCFFERLAICSGARHDAQAVQIGEEEAGEGSCVFVCLKVAGGAGTLQGSLEGVFGAAEVASFCFSSRSCGANSTAMFARRRLRWGRRIGTNRDKNSRVFGTPRR